MSNIDDARVLWGKTFMYSFFPVITGSILLFYPNKVLNLLFIENNTSSLNIFPQIDIYTVIFIIFLIMAITSWCNIFAEDMRNKNSVRFVMFTLLGQTLAFILMFASIYKAGGLKGLDPPLDIGTALYFSIVTWTTLGYGDLQPIEQLRLVAAFEALLGYVYLGLIVGLTVHVGAERARPAFKEVDKRQDN